MPLDIAAIQNWEGVITLAKRLYLEGIISVEECNGMIAKAKAEIKQLLASA